MAAAGFAIELPTNRQSRYYDGPAPNVHDPNYIPVLNGADLRVDFSKPSFSNIPSIPTPHQNEHQTSLKRSKSSLAPETVVQSHDAHPMPPRPAITRYTTPQEIGSSHQLDMRTDARSSNNSPDNTASGSDASTTGPSGLEEHVFMIPGNTAPKVEEIQFPTIPASARSSFSSTHKSNVPTSRYNKKTPSTPSLPTISVLLKSQQSPLGSRGASPEFIVQNTSESARSTPVQPTSGEQSPMVPPVSTPRLQAMKSTASERRARALHSHPSNISLKSRRNSTVEETDEAPLMAPAHPVGSRASSVRSRSQSICNSTQPTPAPNAPLPNLPSGAKRPPTREKPIEKPLPAVSPKISSPPPTKTQNDHLEMADFMTTRKTTVFRRFDEVHVRLLLHLQDEITSLERALKEIEDAGSGKPEQLVAKANIMRELRKALAEYDHLFANWTSMQANKASPEAKEQLEKWLQSPSLESGKVSKAAMDDLYWLQNSRDLSAVSFDPEKRSARTQTSESISKGSGQEGSNGVGAFLALFGCASKRK